jgi:transcriptional regulator
MLEAVVGLEITVTKLEGKWKVSQNRPQPDRAGVVTGLRRLGMPSMAELVESEPQPSSETI